MNEEQFLDKATHSESLSHVGLFMGQVYGWMTLGLFTSAAVAFFFNFSPALRVWLVKNSEVAIFAFMIQLVLVFVLSAGVHRLNPIVAAVLFTLYSALMGFTLSGILMVYTAGSVFGAFVATAGTFMAMSVVGFVTKSDLTKWGNLAIAGLIGIIIATFVNIFFIKSTGMDLFLTYAGILVFLVLIAYDTQKLKSYAAIAEKSDSSMRYAIVAALSLYLDFINLFLRLLSIFGKRR